MRNLLSANFLRLRHSVIFWGSLAVNAFFGAFLLYTHLSDRARFGIEFTLDEIFFGYAMIAGLVMAVFVSTFLGTEYSDGAIRNKLSVGAARRDVYLANLIAVTAAGVLSCGAFMLAALLAGVPFVGFFTVGAKVVLTALLGSLVMCMAFCSLYTLVSMNCTRKAVAAIACILLFFALMMAIVYVNGKLEAPPEITDFSLVDGEFVSRTMPNPRYLDESSRAVYEFLADLLPTGQAIHYFTLTMAHPLRMILASLAVTAASTLGGLVLFQRKDLK